MKIKIIEGDKEKVKKYKRLTIKFGVFFILSITLGLIFGFNFWG